MIIYIQTDNAGRIVSWADRRSIDTEIEVEIDEDDPFLKDMPHKYELKNGAISKSQALEKKLADMNEISEMKQFLIDTDFYYIRKLENGKEIPPEIQAKREKIRKRFSDLGV